METDYITEEIVADWGTEFETMEELDSEMRAWYGVGAAEYITLRNSLVREYEYKLPYHVLEKALLNKVIVDLVGRGYLKIDISMTDGVTVNVTQKGFEAVVKGMDEGDLCPNEDNSLAAIFQLRNKNLLGNEA